MVNGKNEKSDKMLNIIIDELTSLQPFSALRFYSVDRSTLTAILGTVSNPNLSNSNNIINTRKFKFNLCLNSPLTKLSVHTPLERIQYLWRNMSWHLQDPKQRDILLN